MWIIKKRKKLNRILLKVTSSKMKSSLEDLNRRSEQAEKQIRKLEERSTKIIHSVDQKDKRMKRNEQNLRLVGHICIIGISEGQDRRSRKNVWRNNGKNISNFYKKTQICIFGELNKLQKNYKH